LYLSGRPGLDLRLRQRKLGTVAAAPSGLLTNLISYWKLDEASGTRVDSVVASANDLTDNNTVASAAGIIGNAGDFTAGNQENLTRVANASINTGNIDYTLQAWVKLKDKSAVYVLWNKFNTGAADSEYSIFYNNASDRLVFRMFIASGSFVDAVGNNLGSPSDGVWYHILAWHNATANTVNIKINDGTTNSVDTSGASSGGTDGPIRIGGISTAFANAYIDECAFWKRLLTATEMTNLYAGGVGVTYPFTGVP
jgi:hypothetical protein